MKTLKNNKFDIFSQHIIPSKNYILKGDKTPEHEIQPLYLRKMSSRYKSTPKNKYNISTSFNHSLYYTEPSSNEKKTVLTQVKKQKDLKKINEEEYQVGSSDSDSNDDAFTPKNINNSLDKNSSEFLSNLFRQGFCHDEEIENIIQLTQRQKDKFKLKNKDPFIYSFNSLHPFSMFYGTKYDKLVQKNNELKLPAPNFITKEDWCKPEDVSFKNIYKGIEIKDKLGIVISDPVIRKKFSGLLKDIIFQIFKVPFGHHISLNVKIFEPKTILERYTSIFSYANIFLLPASNPQLSPYERFKLVMAFQFGGLYIASQQLKPFNPFVGETYQGELPNGAKLYVENVTHKPLVARFLLIYKKIYEISGFWDLAVKVQSFGNEMVINQKGPININLVEMCTQLLLYGTKFLYILYCLYKNFYELFALFIMINLIKWTNDKIKTYPKSSKICETLQSQRENKLLDILKNIKLIKLFNAEDKELNKIYEIDKNIEIAKSRQNIFIKLFEDTNKSYLEIIRSIFQLYIVGKKILKDKMKLWII